MSMIIQPSRFRPPLNVVLLMHFDGADGSTVFTDVKGKTVTPNGNAQIDTAQSRFGGASGLFDGSGDFLSIPDNNDWHFGTEAFTIELFVRHTGKINDTCYLAQWTGGWAFYIEFGQLKFRARADNNDLLDIVHNWTPNLGQWYHIVAERNSSSRMRLYIDGVMVASTNTTFNRNLNNSTSSLLVGRISGFSSFDFNGHLDELRIVKGQAVYNDDSGFSVPTSPFPDN